MVAKKLRSLVFGIVKFEIITFPAKFISMFFKRGVTSCKLCNLLMYSTLQNQNKVLKPAFCNIVMTKIYKDGANILEILL